jgi:hypothetical protein
VRESSLAERRPLVQRFVEPLPGSRTEAENPTACEACVAESV